MNSIRENIANLRSLLPLVFLYRSAKMCFAKVYLLLLHQERLLGHCGLFWPTFCNDATVYILLMHRI